MNIQELKSTVESHSTNPALLAIVSYLEQNAPKEKPIKAPKVKVEKKVVKKSAKRG